ncbi:hypothetical protein Q8A72_06855 [Aeribacillus pallidus]|nr:hypothetical protein [Aeribacillus pallidus]
MVKPFEPTDNFTKIHNALFELYTRLPDFKPDHALMYIVLMSYWNVEKGYAFPTKAELALRLNCGINKPAALAKVLEKYELIRCVPRHKERVGSNDIYYVYTPITNEKEFVAKYPIECAQYAERERKLLERNIKSNDTRIDDAGEIEELSEWL